jgi:uncharacterized membrane protein YdbT with pleckstrin-like domain
MATTCPACGTAQKDDAAKFCASCGAAIGAAPAAKAAASIEGEQTLFEGSPASIPSIGVLLLTLVFVGIPWLFYFYWKARGTSYKLTTKRVVIESGIFSKKLEQIDLYRVVDYVVDRPFSQRLLGTGNIVLESTDRTSKGEVRIDGIRTDVRALYEKLRAATEADKRARGVRVMDVE